MKKFISIFLSLLILLILNFYLSKFLKLSFLELSFMTGLISTLIIGFFSSEGGLTTRISDFGLRHLFNKDSRSDGYFMKFYFNIPFTISLLYTIVSAIISIIVYWKYF